MVPMLVVLTIVTILLVDWLLERRRRAASIPVAAGIEPARGSARFEESYLHPGHGWARLGEGGTVTVGVDAFARSFAGRLARVELPVVGSRFRQGMPAWTLVSHRGRRLTQVMPVGGEVVEVNQDFVRDPEHASVDSWILRLRPDRIAESLRNLLGADAGKHWSRETRARLTERLHSQVGVLAADGGELIVDFGDALDDVTWESLKRELFPDAGVHVRHARGSEERES